MTKRTWPWIGLSTLLLLQAGGCRDARPYARAAQLTNRTQGIGVQFTQDDTGATARATIEQILGETLASTRPTHTM